MNERTNERTSYFNRPPAITTCLQILSGHHIYSTGSNVAMKIASHILRSENVRLTVSVPWGLASLWGQGTPEQQDLTLGASRKDLEARALPQSEAGKPRAAPAPSIGYVSKDRTGQDVGPWVGLAWWHTAGAYRSSDWELVQGLALAMAAPQHLRACPPGQYRKEATLKSAGSELAPSHISQTFGSRDALRYFILITE